MFRHNVGGVDGVFRLTLGGMFFLAGLFLLTSRIRLGVVLAVVGVLVLLTGIIRFCAVYVPFGISTAPPEKAITQPGLRLRRVDEGKAGQSYGRRPTSPTERGECRGYDRNSRPLTTLGTGRRFVYFDHRRVPSRDQHHRLHTPLCV